MDTRLEAAVGLPPAGLPPAGLAPVLAVAAVGVTERRDEPGRALPPPV